MGDVTCLPPRTPADGEPDACYVRVTDASRRGHVEFQFSIGDPSLFLEMTLPVAAFAEFCAQHRVRHLSAVEAAAVDAGESRWRYGSEEAE